MVSKITVAALVLIVAVPILLGYAMAFEEQTVTGFESTETANITDILNNVSVPVYNRYTGPSNNQTLYMNVYWTGVGWEDSIRSPGFKTISSTPTSTPILTSQTKTYSDIISTSYTEIAETKFTYTSNNTVDFRLTMDDGSTVIDAPVNGDKIMRIGSNVIIGSTTYSNVYKVETSALGGVPVSITIYELVNGSDYGNPSYGWNPVPAGTGWTSVDDVYWMNGYTNSAVRMCINLANNEVTTITPYSSSATAETPDIDLSYTYADGLVVTVDGTDRVLGEYQNVYVEIFADSMKISGISSWPSIGTTPTIYNSITVQYDSSIGDIAKILLDGTSTIEYRVDSAEVLTGYYAAIHDGNMNLGAYYPEKTVTVTFSSIAAYGDEFGWGGQIWNVDNGKIVSSDPKLNGIRIKDAILMEEYVDGDSPYYNFYINDILVGNFHQGAYIWLGGDWSLIAKANLMEETETTELVWQPGVFAWNGVDSSFALMGLITCVGVFIGLGMYGRRSGAKVGTLMLICGGAALIFLALI